MRPENTRILRRERRRAWRGTATGRRTTHRARTAYGQQQRIRDWHTAWQSVRMAAPEFPAT